MRLNDVENQLVEKLKDIEQRVHNMEYDIEHTELKRQADEKKGTDYRMGFDAKIHTINEHLLEQASYAPLVDSLPLNMSKRKRVL
eukprot:9331911-Pyramimonas_sp.AAC.1